MKEKEQPMNVKFDTSKPFNLADFAKAVGETEDVTARHLEKTGFIEWDGAKLVLTERGKHEMPGLRLPEGASGQYGHWDADHWFRFQGRDDAWIRARYDLKPDMSEDAFFAAVSRAEADAEEQKVTLHGLRRFLQSLQQAEK
jgi:hypothetical protein